MKAFFPQADSLLARVWGKETGWNVSNNSTSEASLNTTLMQGIT